MIRTALLIDADNVTTELVAEVLSILGREPRSLQHRRAYGSVQKASEFAEFDRDNAIRFLPSTFAGPNSTDLALAIDAIELLLRHPVDEVVLVSSDTDFAPLVVRLRELGARVIGFGQQGKSASDVARSYERVYDKFTVIDPAKARAPAAPRRRAAAAPAGRADPSVASVARAAAASARVDEAAPSRPRKRAAKVGRASRAQACGAKPRRRSALRCPRPCCRCSTPAPNCATASRCASTAWPRRCTTAACSRRTPRPRRCSRSRATTSNCCPTATSPKACAFAAVPEPHSTGRKPSIDR